MQITITARHFDMGEAQKHYAEQAIRRLNKFFDQIIAADLTVSHEKYRYAAELNMQIDGAVLSSKEEETDPIVAIDQAAAKMERQLKKYKEKNHNHRPKRTES